MRRINEEALLDVQLTRIIQFMFSCCGFVRVYVVCALCGSCICCTAVAVCLVLRLVVNMRMKDPDVRRC